MATRCATSASASGDGIGWGLCDDITHAVVKNEAIIDPRLYHTIKEGKNGLGPAPIKTVEGWLHLAHGVRNTAAGIRRSIAATRQRLRTTTISKSRGRFAPMVNIR